MARIDVIQKQLDDLCNWFFLIWLFQVAIFAAVVFLGTLVTKG